MQRAATDTTKCALQSCEGYDRYTKEDVEQKIAGVSFWGQTVPLPYGLRTPGSVMHNLTTIKQLGLPMDMKGQRVLDIGAWDGFYAFECEKRGAECLAIDNLNRMQKPEEKEHAEIGSAGFETIKDILGSHVAYRDMDVYDLSPEAVGQFDVVLFLGVLYHLKNPALALERVGSVCKSHLFIETEWLRVPFLNIPLIEYLEGDTFNEDPTNWCRPSTAWLKAVLRDLGFKKFEVLFTTKLGIRRAFESVFKPLQFRRGRIVLKAVR